MNTQYKCLKCGEDFTPESHYNRICPKCHESNKKISGRYNRYTFRNPNPNSKVSSE